MVLVNVALILAAMLQVPAAHGHAAAVPRVSVAEPGGASDQGPSERDRIARASSLGAMLYMFDRAAWVSSDALTAVVSRDRLAAIGGYVVENPDPDTLRVTYYRGKAAAAESVFVADVRAGKVVKSQLLATPVMLTPAQALLARARDVAAETARSRGYAPCSPLPFNTVVLPPRADGGIAVYLLTPQQSAGSFPMGGHYRVLVGGNGQVLTSRPYSVGCLDTALPKLPTGATPIGLVVNSLLDPVPTEIHVFASYNLRMPVFVATRDKRLWKVAGSSIALAPAK